MTIEAHGGICAIVKVTGAAQALSLIGTPTRPSHHGCRRQDQTLAATSLRQPTRCVASIGLFGGLQMRNPWVAFVSATKRFALSGALATALISEGAR